MTELNQTYAWINDPGNRTCGCPEISHEPFCDIERYERETKLARVLEVARGLLAYPNKELVPWTEWADLRLAVEALDKRA